MRPVKYRVVKYRDYGDTRPYWYKYFVKLYHLVIGHKMTWHFPDGDVAFLGCYCGMKRE